MHYASIRRYRLNSGSMDDLLHRVDSDFAETIQEAEGFVAYQVLDCGNNEVVSISVFRDSETAEASDELAAEWVSDTLEQAFDITRLETLLAQVPVSRARSEVLEPARH